MARFGKILVRAPNWVGDAVMSLPAFRAIRRNFPPSEIVAVARPWVAGIFSAEAGINRVLTYDARPGTADGLAKWRFARLLRAERFDCAILFQNAFEAALLVGAAGVPKRIGYDRDGRGWLLTDCIPVPRRGEIPRHERFYYLELLRRSGLAAPDPSDEHPIRLEGSGQARVRGRDGLCAGGLALPVIGVSPGAAYGGAKRWLPERFAEAAVEVARSEGASVALFGSAAEKAVCEEIAAAVRKQGCPAHSFAGATGIREFMDLAAACCVFLTNDSGAMHIASALGVPTVAVFGATDHLATGPTGPLARVVREPVDCSPCLLRECPIDHRCMTRITSAQVAGVARELLHVRL